MDVLLHVDDDPLQLHSARGNLPPTVYERNMATKKPILVSQKI